MTVDAEGHTLYRIANAPLRTYPFPHIYVENVFPDEMYGEMLTSWPGQLAMTPLTDTGRLYGTIHKERRILVFDNKGLAALPENLAGVWRRTAALLLGPSFREMVFGRFAGFVRSRFAGSGRIRVAHEAMLVEDSARYSLGPHTDSPTKAVSVLFYLPDDDAKPHLGTSLYVPRDPGFTCRGGPHHAFADFKCVATMPYVRNSMFAFVKSDRSFHGVEPVMEEDSRRLILYDIRAERAAATAADETGPSPLDAGEPEPIQAVERRS